jgi:hypothetical protein
VANPETLQKLGLVGGLVFAAVAGVLYFQATHDSGSERLKNVRSVPPPSSAGAGAADVAGSIPVGVLGMMSSPRVVPADAKKAVKKALKASLPGLGDCYTSNKASSEPDGTLYIKLHTTDAGTARDIQIGFRGPSGAELQACVSGVLGAASFEGVAADTLVSWPLRWKRGEGMRLR